MSHMLPEFAASCMFPTETELPRYDTALEKQLEKAWRGVLQTLGLKSTRAQYGGFHK